MALYGLAIARQLAISPTALRSIHRGGLLHDIGKIGVDDAILRKPDRLTDEEFAQMQRHPVIGYDLLCDLPFLRDELALIRHHHERWDGQGYPDHLAGDEIAIGARILAVADAFDAMTSDRPYRHGLPLAEALRRLREGAGTQFWAPAVAALGTAIERQQIAVPLATLDHLPLAS